MVGSCVRFARGPGPGVNRNTPVHPRTNPRATTLRPTTRAATTLRPLRAVTTLRSTRADDDRSVISAGTEELHDHRPTGAPGPRQSSQRARPGDHSHVQRAGEPPADPPAA